MDNILEIKNIGKKFKKKTIISGIDISIKEGEIFGFVGPNGAGKSTLIKTMLGLYKPSDGNVLINGYSVNDEFERALGSVGAIIENPEVYTHLSGLDNIKMFARMKGSVDNNRITEVIKLVKLENRIKDKVKTYSLGMKQRLGIACALINNPKLLVLDEPTNGLDPLGIKELRLLLKDLSKKEHMSILISSHILSEIELMCDTVCLIDGGKIIDLKDMHNLKKDNSTVVIFKVDDVNKANELIENSKIEDGLLIVKTTKDAIADINKKLVKKDISVFGISESIKSLEDEFLEKTKGTKGQIR